MENNDYRENILEQNFISEEEFIPVNEQISVEESLFCSNEFNPDINFLSEEDEEKLKRNRDNDTNLDGQANSSSSGASSSGTIGAVASTVAAGVTIIVLIVSMIANIGVNFLKFEVFGTFVNYSVNINLELKVDNNTAFDFDNLNTGLFLSVSNDEQNIVTPLDASDKNLFSTYKITSKTDSLIKIEYIFTGKVAGLKSGGNYNLKVFGKENGDEKIYHTKNFTTTGKISKFIGVNTISSSQTDENFYFQLDFIDENNYYNEFTYSIGEIGLEGSYYKGVIKNDKFAKIAINVSAHRGKKCTLRISYYSNDPNDTQDERLKFFMTDVIL